MVSKLIIDRALNTPGFMGEGELTYLASLARNHNSIAEIGTWRGRSARVLCDNTPGIVICVDTWADNAYGAAFPEDPPDLCKRQNWLWNEFRRNLADRLHVNVDAWRMTSLHGSRRARDLEMTFDMIFIDAGHNYEDVARDIQMWSPLLKEGGVLCGHDYTVNHPGVTRAVDELIRTYRIVETIWTTDMEGDEK